jgi:hypothetical protein
MVVVHAEWDEASSTGGALGACSAWDIRTVVVSCADGEFGDHECFIGARDMTGVPQVECDLVAWLRPPRSAGGVTP